METSPEQALKSIRGPRSVTYIVHRDRAEPQVRRRCLWHRSASPSVVVVLAGLVVAIITVVAIIFQLVVWFVLT